jgi:cytochrome c peroxidase
MRTRTTATLLIFVLAISLFACSKIGSDLKPTAVSLNLPGSSYDYSSIETPQGSQFTGVDNQIATLGRVLFYDTHLSVNNSISCGSCHKQSIAFSDDVAFSPGFENHSTLRNTLPIQNVSNSQNVITGGGFGFNNPSLFWDGRATFLPAMVLMPITNHVEMGMSDMNGIVEKVKGLKYYEDLFLNAFGAATVDGDKIASALSSFVSSIGSGNTRFDQARAGQVQLNALEEQGRNLFFNKYNCNSCHQTEQANGYEMGGGFVNIGLDAVYTDKGRQNVSNDVADNGKFKIPNLRNISLTGPYMHDGRFSTLDQVLDHYSQGIAGSPALDPRLKDQNGNPMRMNISAQEKTALKAFLGTLTDYKMITDPKYSNPFAAK